MRYFRILVEGLWCQHEDIIRVNMGRMWTECLKCGRETRGIIVRPASSH